MNNSVIIRLPAVLQKGLQNSEVKAVNPVMPSLQFSFLVNKNSTAPLGAKKRPPSPPLPTVEPLPPDKDYYASQINDPELPSLETPDLPEWLKPLDPPRFNCQECGDTFLYESNLRLHLQRRSVRIKFPCEACRSSLTYFNRCSLLAHVRQHLEGSVDLDKAVLMPLDKDSILGNEDEEDDEEDIPLAQLINGDLNGNIEEGDDEIQIVAISSQLDCGTSKKLGRFRCSECFQYLESAQAREDHFSASSGPPSLYCNKCAMACPTKCSLEAHQRIHLKIHPFICPECGIDEYNWNNFQVHLNKVCFHNTRTMGYKCMLCDELEVAAVQPHKHMLSTHSEAYYKCQACPMAFKGPTSFESHKKLSHPNITDFPCKTIFKCPLCDTVFHSRELIINHLNVHMKDEKVQMQSIFCCPHCSSRHRTRSQLGAHMQEQHPQKCEVVPTPNSEDNKPLLPPKMDEQGNIECKSCNQLFQNVRGYNIHCGRRHGQRNFLCILCGFAMPDLRALYLHEQKHIKEGAFLCLLCHNQHQSRDELVTHLDKHVNSFKYPWICTICESSISSQHIAQEHVKKEHHLNHVALRAPKKVEPPSKRVTRNLSLASESDQSSYNRASVKNHTTTQKEDAKLPPIKIRIPLQLVRQHSEDLIELQMDSRSTSPTPARTYVIPTKKLRVYNGSASTSEYICAKCDFQTPDQKDFHKHIQFHRKHTSSLQCPDCGTCFVVEATLRKHLKISHRIADIDGYLEQSGFSPNGQKPTEVREAKNNPRQCTICYQNFETETSLKSHMRSHGMAFIRSRTSSS